MIELSSKTGEGMDAWCDEIVERARRVREGRIQHHGHHTMQQAAAALKFEIAGIVQGSVSVPMCTVWLCGTD